MMDRVSLGTAGASFGHTVETGFRAQAPLPVRSGTTHDTELTLVPTGLAPQDEPADVLLPQNIAAQPVIHTSGHPADDALLNHPIRPFALCDHC